MNKIVLESFNNELTKISASMDILSPMAKTIKNKLSPKIIGAGSRAILSPMAKTVESKLHPSFWSKFSRTTNRAATPISPAQTFIGKNPINTKDLAGHWGKPAAPIAATAISKKPSKMSSLAKGVIGGGLATAGIIGGGIAYGGMTQRPGLPGSGRVESPSVNTPYGGNY
jgi:hypothetical protein